MVSRSLSLRIGPPPGVGPGSRNLLASGRNRYSAWVWLCIAITASLSVTGLPVGFNGLGNPGATLAAPTLYDGPAVPLPHVNRASSSDLRSTLRSPLGIPLTTRASTAYEVGTPVEVSPLSIGGGAKSNYVANCAVYDPNSGNIFFANGATSTIAVFNTTTDLQTSSFVVGNRPCALAFDNTTGVLYAGDSGVGYVYEINPTTGAVLTQIAVPSQVGGLAYDYANDTLFVTISGTNEMVVVSTVTQAVVATLVSVNHPVGVAYDPADNDVYVANSGPYSISVVSATSYQLVTNINMGVSPNDVVYDPQNQSVFVSVPQSGEIILLHGIAAITYSGAAFQPGQMAWDPVNQLLYLTPYSGAPGSGLEALNISSGAFISLGQSWGSSPYFPAVDPSTGELFDYSSGIARVLIVSTVLHLGTPRVAFSGISTTGSGVTNLTSVPSPYGLAYNPDSSMAYVSDYSNATVSAYNLTTNALVFRASTGGSPVGVAFDPTAGEIFVANSGSATFTKMNAATGASLTTYGVWPNPLSVVYDEARGYVEVANNDNVTIFNSSDSLTLSRIQTGYPDPYGETIDGASGMLIVASCTLIGGVLSIINPAPPSATSVGGVGSCDTAITYDPANGDLYVADEASGQVDVVGGVNYTLIDHIPVGLKPLGVAYDPANGYVYVANAGSGTISVINDHSQSVIANISVGGSPQSVAFASRTASILLTNPAFSTLQSFPSEKDVVPATSNVFDVGRSASFTAPLPEEGAGRLRESLSVTPGYGLICQVESPGHALLPFTCTGNTSGNYTVDLTVNDSIATVVSSVNVTVAPLPSEGPITASPPSIDLNNASVTFSASPIGGTPPYTFRWTTANATLVCPGSTSATLSCLPTAAGNFTVTTGFMDADGVYSGNVSTVYQVFPRPAVTLSESASAIDVGQAVNFTAVATLGNGIYHYTYSGLPTGCLTSNLSTLPCLPTQSGNFSGITVRVRDTSGGANLSSPVNLTVYPRPQIVLFRAVPANDSVGVGMSFAVIATGGEAPYSYAYSGLPAGCNSVDTGQLNCTPSATGTYNVSVLLKDSLGETSLGYAPLTVYSLPVVSGFHLSPDPVVAGQPVALSSSISGGTPPYSLSYTGLPLGCLTEDLANWTCTPVAAGNYSITLHVVDGGGSTTSAQAPLTVTPQSGGPVITSFVATPDPVGQGTNITIRTTVSGGKAPLSYLYSGLPPGCYNTNASAISCAPTSPGNYSIEVFVRDTLGRLAHGNLSLEVLSSGKVTPPTVTLVSSGATITAGGTVNLTAQVTGGLGPFRYAWSLNGTNVSTAPDAPQWSESLAHPGTYQFRSWIVDGRGQAAGSNTVTVSVIVKAPTTTSQNALAFNTWIYVIIGAVVILAILLLLFRRRKAGPAERSADRHGARDSDAGASAESAPSPPGTPPSSPVPGSSSDSIAAGSPVAESALPSPTPSLDDVEEARKKRISVIGLTECPLCRVALPQDMKCPQCGMDWSPKPAGSSSGASSTTPSGSESSVAKEPKGGTGSSAPSRSPDDIEDELRRAEKRIRDRKESPP